MKNILITGATGNVGFEVIKSLCSISHSEHVIAGVRHLEVDGNKLADYKSDFRKFNFTDINSFDSVLENIDILFLLRPPQISNVKKYFKPLLLAAIRNNVQHIVFLSVQGVEKSKWIPHYKIEKIIIDSKIPYTFLRPAYFMQNFLTSLNDDLIFRQRIFLPAGNIKFTLIDVRDIGKVAAIILINTTQHLSAAYELTSKEILTFKEMAGKLSSGLGHTIQFQSPNLLNFYLAKRREKVPTILILVMIMLHYLPRFQKAPAITDNVERIAGIHPVTFDQFIIDNKSLLTG